MGQLPQRVKQNNIRGMWASYSRENTTRPSQAEKVMPGYRPHTQLSHCIAVHPYQFYHPESMDCSSGPQQPLLQREAAVEFEASENNISLQQLISQDCTHVTVASEKREDVVFIPMTGLGYHREVGWVRSRVSRPGCLLIRVWGREIV